MQKDRFFYYFQFSKKWFMHFLYHSNSFNSNYSFVSTRLCILFLILGFSLHNQATFLESIILTFLNHVFLYVWNLCFWKSLNATFSKCFIVAFLILISMFSFYKVPILITDQYSTESIAVNILDVLILPLCFFNFLPQRYCILQNLWILTHSSEIIFFRLQKGNYDAVNCVLSTIAKYHECCSITDPSKNPYRSHFIFYFITLQICERRESSNASIKKYKRNIQVFHESPKFFLAASSQ